MAESLAVARGDRTVLDGVSFVLAAGGLLHLRGHNGAGKTSLLEVLAGLRPAASGRVRGPSEQAWHWIGHRNALNLALSPIENLSFWCGLNRAPAAAIVPALEQVGLTRLRHRACRTLSAGQKRRAALARLLVQERPLWILDEPLSGLDAAGLALFASLVERHLERGGSAIVTSHQPLPGALDARPGAMTLHLGGGEADP